MLELLGLIAIVLSAIAVGAFVFMLLLAYAMGYDPNQ